jgi:hypothetical protein
VLAGAGIVLFLAAAAAFAVLGYGLYLALGGRRLANAAAVILPLLGVALAIIHKGALSISAALVLVALAVSLPLAPGALLTVRQLAMLTRRLSGDWCAVPIASPYRTPPASGALSFRGRLSWLLGDPASWRDLLGWRSTRVRAGSWPPRRRG